MYRLSRWNAVLLVLAATGLALALLVAMLGYAPRTPSMTFAIAACAMLVAMFAGTEIVLRYELLTSSATDAMQAGDPQRAERLLDRARLRAPLPVHRRNIARLRGLLHYRQGRLDEALRELDIACQPAKDDGAAEVRRTALATRSFVLALAGRADRSLGDLDEMRAAWRWPYQEAWCVAAELLLVRDRREDFAQLLWQSGGLLERFLTRRERLLLTALLERGRGDPATPPELLAEDESASEARTFRQQLAILDPDLPRYAPAGPTVRASEPWRLEVSPTTRRARRPRVTASIAAGVREPAAPSPRLSDEEAGIALFASHEASPSDAEDLLWRVIADGNATYAADAGRYLGELLLENGRTAEALVVTEEALTRAGERNVYGQVSGLRAVILAAEGRFDEAAAEQAALIDWNPCFAERSSFELRARIFQLAVTGEGTALAALARALPLDARVPWREELLVDVAVCLEQPPRDDVRWRQVRAALRTDSPDRPWVLRFFPGAAEVPG